MMFYPFLYVLIILFPSFIITYVVIIIFKVSNEFNKILNIWSLIVCIITIFFAIVMLSLLIKNSINPSKKYIPIYFYIGRNDIGFGWGENELYVLHL